MNSKRPQTKPKTTQVLQILKRQEIKENKLIPKASAPTKISRPLLLAPVKKEIMDRCTSSLRFLKLIDDFSDKEYSPAQDTHWSDISLWENGKNVEAFFDLIKLHLAGHAITVEKAKAIRTAMPYFEYVLNHIPIANKILPLLANGFLTTGKAEKFFGILRAYDALAIIFPFLKNTSINQNAFIRRFLEKTDKDYAEKNGLPSLYDFVLKLMSTSIVDSHVSKNDPAVNKSKAMEYIYRDKVLKSIFVPKRGFEKEKLQASVLESLYIELKFQIDSVKAKSPVEKTSELESKKDRAAVLNKFFEPALAPIAIVENESIVNDAYLKAISFLDFLRVKSPQFFENFVDSLFANASVVESTSKGKYLFALNRILLGHTITGHNTIKRLAEQNYRPAQCEYARISRSQGQLETAIEWYKKAAEAGFHHANMGLSECYPANSADALAALERAANAGLSEAQYKAAKLCAHFAKEHFELSQKADVTPCEAEKALNESKEYHQKAGIYYAQAANQECLLSRQVLDVCSKKEDNLDSDISQLSEDITARFSHALKAFERGLVPKAIQEFHVVAGKIRQLNLAKSSAVTPLIDLQDKLTSFLIAFPEKHYPLARQAVEIYKDMRSSMENVEVQILARPRTRTG